jgi:hypothetical protein
MERTTLVGGTLAIVIIGFFVWLSSLIVVEIGDQSTPLTTTKKLVVPTGKIDVRVACESGLMYTTFSSSEEADVFVAECVEGKYPEVIERYIESMDLDGAKI